MLPLFPWLASLAVVARLYRLAMLVRRLTPASSLIADLQRRILLFSRTVLSPWTPVNRSQSTARAMLHRRHLPAPPVGTVVGTAAKMPSSPNVLPVLPRGPLVQAHPSTFASTAPKATTATNSIATRATDSGEALPFTVRRKQLPRRHSELKANAQPGRMVIRCYNECISSRSQW